jgi:hypothetical protein
MNNPDHISDSLEKLLRLKYLNSLLRIRDPGWKTFESGSGMGKIQIRDKHPGSATLKKRMRKSEGVRPAWGSA